MDRHLARQYRERWGAVEAVETAELRRAGMAQRLQQMDAIYRLAVGLKLAPYDSEDKTAVRARWARLKRGRR